MLILVKTPTITFSLDVQPEDSTEVLYNKVGERTEYKRFQFELLFAGDKLSKGTIGGCGVKKESTIHMIVIKELKFTVRYKENEYPLAMPNNAGLQISHMISQIKNTLRESIPQLSNSTIAVHVPGNPAPLYNYTLIQDHFKNFEVVELSLVEKPVYKTVEPYIPTYGSMKMKDAPSPVTYKSSSVESAPIIQQEEEQFDADGLLSSFVESSISSDVEVVFCFDTTGSMSSIIKNVRTQVKNTVTRLMRDIPNIRIGIMGLGDYCDKKDVLTTLDLTQNVEDLVSFINKVPDTNGGDSPEAYEYALYRAKELSWSTHTSKAFVMIGDANPHPPSYTDLKINWFKECDDLHNMGIKVYGVKALGRCVFYDEIAERTGGICITFNKFNLITEMFLAICYREASSKKFKEYEKEIAKEGDSDLKQILNDLNQENFTVESTVPAPSPDTVCQTNQRRVQGRSNYIHHHNDNNINYHLSHLQGYLKGYFFIPEIGYFKHKRELEKEAQTNTSSSTYSSRSSTATSSSSIASSPTPLPTPTPSTSTPPPAPVVVYTPPPPPEPLVPVTIFNFNYQISSMPVTSPYLSAMVIGADKVGKTTFTRSISFVAKNYKGSIQFREKTHITVDEFRDASCFVICLDMTDAKCMEQLPLLLSMVRQRELTKPIFVAGLKSDGVVPNSVQVSMQSLAAVYSVLDSFTYSQYMSHEQIKDIELTMRKKLQPSGKASKKEGASCSIM
ncbi:hypothetical protein SAMD00019534_059610 [Acytostelium subglobosum LB1]|uniref:hypothetical protein n=1 Tax=Acytostelium subglobosum LB1 TaxID=1410327 RepID=UPI0006450211|nr:hypothetical protein SAMD00019534_059610 [Acytostelium subglobosum LB1]GAM22786.1 hypothetical protein SAMD00019534_059610 [Acytostelium subglobosum LB1]|eukprot:XP_012754013.1 hypothetical protein SAMD00019534_059610 [Acytostelium subglobosum LB1]